MKKEFEIEFGGKVLKVETGELAKQAGGSVLVRYGDTVILSVATASNKAKDIDFFPLTVLYEEKLYSVGKIPGGFLRREGRPSEHATLTSRLIDRTIRPLFADGFRNEVQVVNTVLSYDENYSSDMAAMFGASLSLCVSDIPFEGPIAGVTVGLIDGEFAINPNAEDMKRSKIHLVVAGTSDAINMVEAGAYEVSEEIMLDAMMFGHETIKELCAFQVEVAQAVAKEKMAIQLYEIPEDVKNEVKELVEKDLRASVAINGKEARYSAIDQFEEKAYDHFSEKEYDNEASKKQTLKFVKEMTHDIVADEVRRLISVEKIRPDGRKPQEVRALNVQIDLLNRAHGSGLFTRGETQVLSILTLGALADNQIIDDLSDVDRKRFMHQYNFPPYSVGETGRMGAPGRREVGHGALGERALSYVLPDAETFPYAIRIVSEVLESNGSSSQASICASSVALMAAGVPITGAVSGIAMGMVQYGDDYTILTDIQGMEDHFGDMDFKVAGTKKGITALQMDIKIAGLSRQILKEALEQAHIGRAEMMRAMDETIDTPRDNVGTYAPKMSMMMIHPDKIRAVIGQGGKVINQIIEDCDNVKIDIEDDGRVVIYHTDQKSIDKARQKIENIVREAKVDEIFEAKVMRIEKFGAFVNLFGTTDALLHVSKMAHHRVEDPAKEVEMGQIIQVIVTEIDDKGRVGVSRKALLPKPETNKPEMKKETQAE